MFWLFMLLSRSHGMVLRARSMHMSLSSVSTTTHKSFIQNIAKTAPPQRLDTLIELLALSGETIVEPAERNKQNLNPFLIPLSKHKDGSMTCYIRWPTQKDTMDLQIVKTTEAGVILRSLGTDQMARRLVAELDFFSLPEAPAAHALLTKSGLSYTLGDYIPLLKSGKFETFSKEDLQLILDRYLLTKVGAFPDCYERLASNFLAKGDAISALITCERAVSVFYGWGHPMTFHAKILNSIPEREKEGRDTAKASLGMPKWTLASTMEELEAVVKQAGFSGLPIIAELHAFRANDPRTADITEGMSPIQVTLDQVAHYMDAVALGHVPGGWSAARDIIASKYSEGGYPELVEFIKA